MKKQLKRISIYQTEWKMDLYKKEKKRVYSYPPIKIPENIKETKYLIHIFSVFETILMEKIYHIYVSEKCLFHSLSEEKFLAVWETLNRLLEIANTSYKKSDLSYEELLLNKETVLNSSY